MASRPPIKLRRAIEDDTPALAAFARATWIASFAASVTEADVEQHLSAELSDAAVQRWLSEDRAWLACSGAELVGYAHFGSSPFEEAAEQDAALHRLYVANERRNEGIGQSLLSAGLAEQPVDVATWLEVWTENPGAIRFYRRQGFEPVRERAFVSPTGIEGTPDLIMRRPPG